MHLLGEQADSPPLPHGATETTSEVAVMAEGSQQCPSSGSAYRKQRDGTIDSPVETGGDVAEHDDACTRLYVRE